MAAQAGSDSAYWPGGNGSKVCTDGFGGGKSSKHATADLPQRKKNGKFEFEGEPLFCPNVAPWEVLQKGAFGGTYYRTIKSGVTGETHSGAWKEFPEEWFSGLDIKTQVASATYNEGRNRYGVKCGSGLDAWEEKGWIDSSAPFGWFHWYCRYFMGLRGDDDQRQISRWNKCAGLKSGRWVRNLVTKVCRAQANFDDEGVSPVVRQTLLHWGYELTDADFLHIARSRGMLSDEESGDAASSESEEPKAPKTSGGSKRSREKGASSGSSSKASRKE